MFCLAFLRRCIIFELGVTINMTLKKLLFGKAGSLDEFFQDAKNQNAESIELRIDTTRKALDDDLGIAPEDMDIIGVYGSKIWLNYSGSKSEFLAYKISNKNTFVEYSAGYKQRLLAERDNILSFIEGSGISVVDVTDYDHSVYQNLHKIP